MTKRATRSVTSLFVAFLAVAAALHPANAAAQRRDSVPVRAGNARPMSRQDSLQLRALQQQFGRGLTQAQVIDRIKKSNLSRAEVRTRLQIAGYDPSLADRYFDLIESGDSIPTGNAPDNFVTALSRIGLINARTGGSSSDSLRLDSFALDSMALDSIAADSLRRKQPNIFGLSFFRHAAAEFEPSLMGPVDPDYRLGPGDELNLVITGDIEAAYPLQVSRQGIIVIPDVGQMSVNGLTLGQLEDRLYPRLGNVYSGISRSSNASTRFSVSLGKLRTNRVFITGDVTRAGAYQISSVGTVFNALYAAGGPTAEGSFRRIEVRRGSRLVGVVDLYDYLLRGDASSDIRLEQNDRVFVPPAGPQVSVEGAVRRAMIYEVTARDSLKDVLQYAGGLQAKAITTSVKIDRILSPSERRPGIYRTLVDVDLGSLQRGTDVALRDGDIVQLDAVSDVRRNRVWLEGDVRNPGMFEWSPGLTLSALIRRGEGVQEDAYTSRVHIFRLNRAKGTRELVSAAVGVDSSSSVVLQDADSVFVYSVADLSNPSEVGIDGFVKEPGIYPLAEGMTLRDLILIAGGFRHGAYVLEAEISRQPNPLNRSDTTASVQRIALRGSNEPLESANPTGRISDLPAWVPAASEVRLQHGDRVSVRQAPGYEPVRDVTILGQIMLPGTYVLTAREERLSDVVSRAGGVTPQAYISGLHVVRKGRVVAADLGKGLRNPVDKNNIVLESGDSITVPAYDPLVSVTGAVIFDGSVLYQPGKSLDWYISQVGGYDQNADKRRVSVKYQNGQRDAPRHYILFSTKPKMEPGATIFVPAKPKDKVGFDWGGFITRTVGVLGTLATVAIAVKQIKQ